MTRALECSPKVIALRHPKRESESAFRERAQALANALYEGPKPVAQGFGDKVRSMLEDTE